MRVKPWRNCRTSMRYQWPIYEAAALSTRRRCKMWRQPLQQQQFSRWTRFRHQLVLLGRWFPRQPQWIRTKHHKIDNKAILEPPPCVLSRSSRCVSTVPRVSIESPDGFPILARNLLAVMSRFTSIPQVRAFAPSFSGVSSRRQILPEQNRKKMAKNKMNQIRTANSI